MEKMIKEKILGEILRCSCLELLNKHQNKCQEFPSFTQLQTASESAALIRQFLSIISCLYGLFLDDEFKLRTILSIEHTRIVTIMTFEEI